MNGKDVAVARMSGRRESFMAAQSVGASIAVARKERSMSVYQRNGYKSRRDYLESLAFEYDVPEFAVFMLADMLGPNEDFDGLVSSLEDYEDWDF